MWIKFLLKITSKLSFITFFLLIFTTSAQAALELRVAIKKGVNNLQIGSSTPAVIKDSTRKTIGQVDGMNSFVAKPSGGKVSLAGW
ncbi:MAG: sporulation protein, partial [Cyanobacteria bacterium]|nr:sporulation protein [Cyanobacteria bacterium CG_2015-02_32_10]